MYDFIGQGAITQSESIAEEDLLVYQVQTTSVFGALETEEDKIGSDDFSQSFVNLVTDQNTDTPAGDFEFEINQTNADANRESKDVALQATENNDGLFVVPDQSNSTLFVILDTDETEVARNGNLGSVELQDGDEYEANFTIAEGSNIVDEEPGVSILDTASIVEKSLEFDTGEDNTIRVEAAAGQTISGTTSVAPGTELNLRIRSTGTSPFLEDPTTIVQSDGSFNTTVDFSNRAENKTFEATAREFDDDDTETPGVIGSAPTASVVFDDQEVTDGTVTVQTVTMSEGGFVAIHQGSATGPVIGNSEYLEPGESTSIEIDVGDLSEDQTLVAMAHLDTNGNEEYEFGDVEGADGPYTTSGGAPVIDSANITVVEETTTETPETETTESTTTQPEETTEMGEMTTEEPTEETTEGDGPGFTAVLAVLAMLGAALLVARRRE